MLRNKYYIGDPCYVLSEKNMSALIEAIQGGAKGLDIEGHMIYFAVTAYGDGEYELKDSHGTIAKLGVDAGLLSLIPNALLADPANETEDNRGITNRHLGHMYYTYETFRADDGFFSFGDGLYCDTR